MEPKGFHPKHTAILSANVAGYSFLMQGDVAAADNTLESYKQGCFELIKQRFTVEATVTLFTPMLHKQHGKAWSTAWYFSRYPCRSVVTKHHPRRPRRMESFLPCSLPCANAGGRQILRCQGIAVNDYRFTPDALTLKPASVCNVGVKYAAIN
jgi:hypothetical protein